MLLYYLIILVRVQVIFSLSNVDNCIIILLKKNSKSVRLFTYIF